MRLSLGIGNVGVKGVRKKASRPALRLGDRRLRHGVVNLAARGMLVVSVARRLGSGNSFEVDPVCETAGAAS
jgi:hypothetical protein